MKLKIINITDRGIKNKERLVLKVLNNLDLSSYLIYRTKYLSEDEISNADNQAYWFPPQNVKAGDFVVLYSGSGMDRISKNKTGTKTYTYFMGEKNTIWSDNEDAAVVFEISTWETTPQGNE